MIPSFDSIFSENDVKLSEPRLLCEDNPLYYKKTDFETKYVYTDTFKECNNKELIDEYIKSNYSEEYYSVIADIDSEIYESIKLFNNKGYHTLFSCSGHMLFSELIYHTSIDRLSEILDMLEYNELYLIMNYIIEDKMYIMFDLERSTNKEKHTIVKNIGNFCIDNPEFRATIDVSYDPNEVDDLKDKRIILLENSDKEYTKLVYLVENFFDGNEKESKESKVDVIMNIIPYIRRHYKNYTESIVKDREKLYKFANNLRPL